MKQYFAFLFFSIVVLIPLGANAQTTCVKFPSNSVPPSGVDVSGHPWSYGASWDVFSPGRELLVKTNCPTSGTNLNLTVGRGDANQLVYNTSYAYRVGVIPPWQPTTLSGTVATSSWLAGTGTASLTAPVSTSPANPFFYVGYVCTNRGTAGWKCGCNNSSCSISNWQLQGYTGNGGGTTGGTGGTTGGVGSCPTWKNDLVKNPFNKNSIYHIPLASGVTYAGDTAPTTLAWKANAFGTFTIGCSIIPFDNMSFCNPNGHSIFVAPVGTSAVTINKLTDTASSLPVTLRIPDEAKINIGNGAGEDATISIFYPDTETVHILYKYSWNSGNPEAQRYISFSARSSGHPNRLTDPDMGTIAAGVANWMGILRGHEVVATGQDFNHRFKLAVSRKDNQNTTHILGRGFHLPANGTDGDIQPTENLGPFSYGDIVALPQSVNIDSLGLSEPGKRFARAMQKYGVIIVDGGPNGIRTDQYVPRAERDLIRTDFRTIWPMMRRVEDFTTNADFDTAIAAGKIGPGTPLGPNCAYDAP